MTPPIGLRERADAAARRLLGGVDLDPYSPTLGCFDRRYWGWKLIDSPDGSQQRGVQPLALLWADPRSVLHMDATVLRAIEAGLLYSARVQHPDGSFDQAFPNDRSFAATAFVLDATLAALESAGQNLDIAVVRAAEASATRAALFLCRSDERHGFIGNHLACASLALQRASERFASMQYARRAENILGVLLQRQSVEGWFPEYGGADPGYQSLAVSFLAEIERRTPSVTLTAAIDRSVRFLTLFAHPDGTFGGEYGSRRSAVLYPGGVALRAAHDPASRALAHHATSAIAAGRCVGLEEVDLSNVAPLLVGTWQLATVPDGPEGIENLPWASAEPVSVDLPEAGLSVRGTRSYYAVVGWSNGGVVKVFARDGRCLCDDAGWVGALATDGLITSQVSATPSPADLSPGGGTVFVRFHAMQSALPTPWRFLVLRLANLTVMQHGGFREWVKRTLVRYLIGPGRVAPVSLERALSFTEQAVTIHDVIRADHPVVLQWLESGQRFVSIHMASARYYAAPGRWTGGSAVRADPRPLANGGAVERRLEVRP